MADNDNLIEESTFYLDPNLIVKRSFSYTNYHFYSRSIDYQNNPINRKYIGQFILRERLGQGTFGIVVIGTHKLTGEKVAVKILDKEKILQETDKFRLEREIKILKKMRHNNIVHLYDVKETPLSLYIIMEYICGQELFEYIISNKKLSEMEACKFYQQIISGIEYLGKIKVVHRDIKPENLLLDNNHNIKIVDFGLSNSYPKNQLLTTACGSPCYAAPEMINGEKYYGLKTDIWSSGIVLYAMLCGFLPFEDADNEKLYKKITEGKFKTPNFLTDSAKDFLHQILNVDPKTRITIPQMKKHPWFNLINPKINMSEGLLLNKIIVPIDENIINRMVNEYKFNGEEVRTNLLLNNHNHITTTYFLILNQKLRKGEKTIGNMKSKEFLNYIHNPNNLLSYYGNNMKKIIQIRAKNIENKPIFEEKDIKNKRNKNSANGFSAGTQSGSTGIMNAGSSIEKFNRKEKRENSATQRVNYKLLREKNRRRNKTKIKYIPKSVDTKKKMLNEKREKLKEKKNKINRTPDSKLNQIKNNNLNKNAIINLKGLEKIKNKKRNTELKNKKFLFNELKTEEKENRKNNKYILEEIDELKTTNNVVNTDYNYNNSSERKENKDDPKIPNIKKINKLNKKAITNKNIINSKKNKFEFSLIEKKDNEKRKKEKKLIDKTNITERRMQLNSYSVNKQNILNDAEKENIDLIVNTDINKYVKLSKIIRRMNWRKRTGKKKLSRRNSSLDEDSSIRRNQLNMTEKDYLIKKEMEKEPKTDRYENDRKDINSILKKRNIITNIYNLKYQKKKTHVIKKRKPTNKILKKKKKKFIDTSVSFDKTNNEIEKTNKNNILIIECSNHIEENDSYMESSDEYLNNETKNDDNKNNNDENNNEEERLKNKEKDIQYLKLKSKHKAFNVVKFQDDKKNNSIKNSFKNQKYDRSNDNDRLIGSFKKTKTKNYNPHFINSIINSKYNRIKNMIIDKEKIRILNLPKDSSEKKQNIIHYSTIKNYQKYLNFSKKKNMTEKFGKIEEKKKLKHKNSSNSFNEDYYKTLDNNSSYSKHKNRLKKNNNKNKNTELDSKFDEFNMNNNIKIFDLNNIYYFKNCNDIKEIKEKLKKELDNKKIKYNLIKNKFYCYYKNDNKFEIDIYHNNEAKNIYIIKYVKKFGNNTIIKEINKFILSKLNYY